MWALDGERRGDFGQRAASKVISARTVKHVGLHLRMRASQFSESERPLERARCFGTRTEIELKSLILAQIERWRHALHMQVERQRGLRSGGEWRTGE